MTETITEQKPQTPAAPAEAATISEKKFMRDHTTYSAISSWLFAIAGATNIGVLSVLSSKMLSAAEQGKPLFKSKPGTESVMGNKKFNRIAVAMTAFGAVCMGVSNWLESKKVVTEWQLGAGKLQRKANVAESELKQTPDKDAAIDTSAKQQKKWAAAHTNAKRLVTRVTR
jgi:hypothetical protein